MFLPNRARKLVRRFLILMLGVRPIIHELLGFLFFSTSNAIPYQTPS